jgi:hypothetical protein
VAKIKGVLSCMGGQPRTMRLHSKDMDQRASYIRVRSSSHYHAPGDSRYDDI